MSVRRARRAIRLVSERSSEEMLAQRWAEVCGAWVTLCACPWCGSNLSVWRLALQRFEGARLRYLVQQQQQRKQT